MYYAPPAWLKHSYSHRRIRPSPSITTELVPEPPTKRHKPVEVPVREKPRPVLRLHGYRTNRVKSKYDKILPEVQVQIRGKSSVSSLHLQGTPTEIGHALKFEHIVGKEEELFQDIKKSLKQLRVQT